VAEWVRLDGRDIAGHREIVSDPSEELRKKLNAQIYAMLRYLSAEGREIPEIAFSAFTEGKTLAELGDINHKLGKLVAPARPETLELLADYDHKNSMFLSRFRWFRRLLAVPLAYTFVVGALLALFVVLVLGSNEEIMRQGRVVQDGTAVVQNEAQVGTSSGEVLVEKKAPDEKKELAQKWDPRDVMGFNFVLLLWYLYLFAAAMLGAFFVALYNINYYIVELKYDDTHVPVHVLRVVIGSVAGVVLSVILVQQGVVDLVGNDGANKSISIAVLALLGGFSGTLVYRVIQRLISVIESLITEDPRAVVERTEREVNAKAAVATAETQKADVDKLQTVLSQLGTNPAAAEAELRKLIQDKGGAPALSTMERRQEMLKTGVAALKPESDPQVAEAEPEPPKAPDEGAQSRT
jgi:hypothetical protein